MDATRWQGVQRLFLAAREWPVGERAARLADACAADATLRADVESLLAADAHTGVLDVPHARTASLETLLHPPAPECIGAWRVVRELGRGGMGTVYLGERADGQFPQRVAIKLIRTPDPADPLHARFLAERRILAALEHPHIARLIDGGITADGLPYLVMEFIDGVPITGYCDAHRLDVVARLRLFGDVCAAVRHAHRNLVIHRDLKPANILVSADGRVHLLDFGIARLLDRSGETEAPGAAPFERALTPGYASPEQVRGEALSTATDVYSLGTLLYELLTGCRPFEGRATTAELLDAVRTQAPERPSTRMGDRDADAVNRAHRRASTPDRLRARLEGDLDSIVLRALCKEPHHRYASVEEFVADIERHLGGFPVLARQGGRRYRVSKLVQRRRPAIAAAAIVVLSLLSGLGAALWQASAAGRERDRAELALAQSQEITGFLMDLFRTAEPAEPADAVTVLDLLRRGTARADALNGQPAVQARLFDVLGQLSTQLGRYDDAQRQLEHAVRLRTTWPGRDSLDLAASLIHLSHVHRSRAEQPRARELVARALELRRSALPPDDPAIADALNELGWLSWGTEQEAYYREALGILRGAQASPAVQLEIQHSLATNLRRRGMSEAAVAADRAALAFAIERFGTEHAETGYAMIHLADQVRDLENDATGAEQLYRRGLELMRGQLGDADVRLVHGLHSLAALRSERGDHDEAVSLLRHSLSIRMAATGPEHPMVAESMALLADALARSGRLDEAGALADDALRITVRVRGGDHPTVATHHLALLARIAEASGRVDEADRLYRDAIRIRADVNLQRDYGRFLIRHGRHAAAETVLLRVLGVQTQHAASDDHPTTRETKRALMELYTAWRRPADVERYRVPPGRFIAY